MTPRIAELRRAELVRWIVGQRAAGHSYRAIGAELGMSGARVGQLARGKPWPRNTDGYVTARRVPNPWDGQSPGVDPWGRGRVETPETRQEQERLERDAQLRKLVNS
jgi:hypothetical protein